MVKSDRVLGVTGTFGYIGKRLVERLRSDTVFSRIVCTDILQPPGTLSNKFHYKRCDIRDREQLYRIFQDGGVDTLIHLAFIANPTRDPDLEYDIDVNGTKNVLDACSRLKIKKLVVASSDCAYGFFEGTPDYLVETTQPRATPGFPYAENKVEIEKLISIFAINNPDCSVVILRPCMVMGPNANNTTSKSMKNPVITAVKGSDPIMQFVHEDDAAEAFYQASVQNVKGIFNLAADNGLRYSELAKELGKPLLSLPSWLIYPLVEVLYRIKVLPFGKAQVDYIRYPLSMNVDKIKKELNFKPRYTSRQAIQSFLKGS
jgi:UDP-glucose 4-epimerase